MNVFKVAWRSLGMAWANYLAVRIAVVMMAAVVFVLVCEVHKSCYRSTHTEITLSTMVRVGDGGWQKAECSTWVEGKSDDLDAKMWGVWVGKMYVTNDVVKSKPKGE